MKLLCCLFSLIIIQVTHAQVIQYMPRNGMPAANSNVIAANQAQNIVANANIPRSPVLTNLPANGMNNAISNAQLANAPIANTQMANAQIANAQIANAKIANAINENAAIVAANQDIATNANLANIANANLANGIANSNLAALASANLANINGNIATFDLGNGFSLTSGSPASPAFGIQVLAESLEVGGSVAVNGQMPIFGTVAINGVVPTDGTATVSYSCGHQIVE